MLKCKYKIRWNPGVKVTQGQKDKIGENIYYSVYTSQIMEDLQANKVMKLKEGDIVSVTVKILIKLFLNY